MIRIAFFGHDAGDAAIRRRVQGFGDDGLAVIGFMMRRRDDVQIDWDNVDLGKTHDAALMHRMGMVFAGARKAAADRDKLAAADLIYARNLDMLLTAMLARTFAGLRTPVVYECLDVHRLLTRRDPLGLAVRRLEGALLGNCARLVVSSPAFLDNHFSRHHAGAYKPVLIENRLAAAGAHGPRPQPTIARDNSRPLRIGWFGVLRCSRSLDLLLGVARRFGDRVQIVLHGRPSLTEVPDFYERVASDTNVVFKGSYRAPEDLARIYNDVDIVWAGDFMEAGFNSVWLLPNRLYEGGYFATPPIAPAGTQTAKWCAQHNTGFEAAEDLEETLPALIGRLLDNPDLISEKQRRLLDLPDDAFVQPRGLLRTLVEDVLATTGPPGKSETQIDARHTVRTLAR